MTKPETQPSFHIRFVTGLKEKLDVARGRRSMNKEINERLSRSFEPDAATKLAEAFRPILNNLDEKERARFVELAVEAVEIMAHSRKGKRRK